MIFAIQPSHDSVIDTLADGMSCLHGQLEQLEAMSIDGINPSVQI